MTTVQEQIQKINDTRKNTILAIYEDYEDLFIKANLEKMLIHELNIDENVYNICKMSNPNIDFPSISAIKIVIVSMFAEDLFDVADKDDHRFSRKFEDCYKETKEDIAIRTHGQTDVIPSLTKEKNFKKKWSVLHDWYRKYGLEFSQSEKRLINRSHYNRNII